ncbi:hypothetical protein VTJ04DRAFT_1053 [Mycothermus thermophilus]|uniref:uncharacterized protein n=1 Tax=Humicola insolens TaxID=85995 RepID=UPI003743668E
MVRVPALKRWEKSWLPICNEPLGPAILSSSAPTHKTSLLPLPPAMDVALTSLLGPALRCPHLIHLCDPTLSPDERRDPCPIRNTKSRLGAPRRQSVSNTPRLNNPPFAPPENRVNAGFDTVLPAAKPDRTSDLPASSLRLGVAADHIAPRDSRCWAGRANAFGNQRTFDHLNQGPAPKQQTLVRTKGWVPACRCILLFFACVQVAVLPDSNPCYIVRSLAARPCRHFRDLVSTERLSSLSFLSLQLAGSDHSFDVFFFSSCSPASSSDRVFRNVAPSPGLLLRYTAFWVLIFWENCDSINLNTDCEVLEVGRWISVVKLPSPSPPSPSIASKSRQSLPSRVDIVWIYFTCGNLKE